MKIKKFNIGTEEEVINTWICKVMPIKIMVNSTHIIIVYKERVRGVKKVNFNIVDNDGGKNK